MTRAAVVYNYATLVVVSYLQIAVGYGFKADNAADHPPIIANSQKVIEIEP